MEPIAWPDVILCLGLTFIVCVTACVIIVKVMK